MRLNFTFFSLLFLSCTVNAQKLTGIWRGYFSSSNGVYREGVRDEMYKYEIQIEQQSNNGLKGVTYSYKSTVFYGKAQLEGILSLPAKTLILKETRLIDLKIGDKSEPCLMTCYLDYARMGKLEVLEGTFISVNIKDKGDCGSGKIYLERVATSDFKKEDFLLKKDTLLKKKIPDTAKPRPMFPVAPGIATDNTKPILKPGSTAGKTDNPSVKNNLPKSATPSQQKPIVKLPVVKNKPGAKDDKSKIAGKSADRILEEPVNSTKEAPAMSQTEIIRKIPIPSVLKERENNLVKTIRTSEENIQIDLYDNGTIDNDTISVYHNNELVVSKNRLTYTAITIKIKCTKADNRHELIVVAENLGDIPPNTALMVITAGKERYEIFLASNEQRNAKIVIEYKPKEK